MKTFRQPLSAVDEARYVSLLQNGTQEEAKQAKELLIEHNLRLVAHIIKKYQNVEEEMDDLLSVGTIGLIKAIDTFEPGKGRLATYACRCIENELLMLFRSKRKQTKEISLYEPIGQDKEGNEIRLLDVIENSQPDVLECMEKEGNIRLLAGLLESSLTGREKEILILRYGLYGGKEKTQFEVGERLGISRSYVSRIEKKAIEKLREGFACNPG